MGNPNKWIDITIELVWKIHKYLDGNYCFYGYLNKDLIVILDNSGIRKLVYPYSANIKLVKNSNNSFVVLKEVV